MDAGRFLRGLRAAVFAAVCVLLAALGHVVMSDATVPAWMLLSAAVVTAAGAWCCAGRERGPVLVGLLTVGTQAALHTAFSFGQAVAGTSGGTGTRLSLARQWAAAWMCGAQSMPASEGGADRMLRLMHRQMATMPGMAGDPAMPGMPGMPGSAHPGGGTGMMAHGSAAAGAMAHGSALGMMAAHLLVALLSAGWLWGGERAAFRLVRSVSARLFAPLVLVLRRVLPTVRPVVRAARQEPRRAVRRLLLAHAMSLRGPPHEPAVG
ncbi:PE-PGRS family protein [Streptomyces sp. NPDC020742]|uniref:PE-PGRS family protein n=1 Tax=Streptomyces sp. NPDC020742 TaxID=3154897 RepID=UPI0033C6AE4D